MKQGVRFPVLMTVAGSVAAGLLLAGSSIAQQPAVQLPEEVTAWLERDQVQRWSRMLQTGQELFSEGSCTRCHGEGGTGGRWGPDLTDDEWVQGDGSLSNIGETIFWGVRRKDFADPDRRFQMNPSGGMDLEFQELAALTAYVWSLSNGTGLPQR